VLVFFLEGKWASSRRLFFFFFRENVFSRPFIPGRGVPFPFDPRESTLFAY